MTFWVEVTKLEEALQSLNSVETFLFSLFCLCALNAQSLLIRAFHLFFVARPASQQQHFQEITSPTQETTQLLTHKKELSTRVFKNAVFKSKLWAYW